MTHYISRQSGAIYEAKKPSKCPPHFGKKEQARAAKHHAAELAKIGLRPLAEVPDVEGFEFILRAEHGPDTRATVVKGDETTPFYWQLVLDADEGVQAPACYIGWKDASK